MSTPLQINTVLLSGFLKERRIHFTNTPRDPSGRKQDNIFIRGRGMNAINCDSINKMSASERTCLAEGKKQRRQCNWVQLWSEGVQSGYFLRLNEKRNKLLAKELAWQWMIDIPFEYSMDVSFK